MTTHDELAATRADRDRLRAALEAAVTWCPECLGRGEAVPGRWRWRLAEGGPQDCARCRPARDALASVTDKGEG